MSIFQSIRGECRGGNRKPCSHYKKKKKKKKNKKNYSFSNAAAEPSLPKAYQKEKVHRTKGPPDMKLQVLLAFIPLQKS